MASNEDQAAWFAAYPDGFRQVTEEDVRALSVVPIEEQYASMARDANAWRARWIMGTVRQLADAAPSTAPWILTAQLMATEGTLSVDATCYIVSIMLETELERLAESDPVLRQQGEELDAIASTVSGRKLDNAGGDMGVASPEWHAVALRKERREHQLLEEWLRSNGCNDVADIWSRKEEFDDRGHKGWVELLGDRHPFAVFSKDQAHNVDPANGIAYMDQHAKLTLNGYPLESILLDARDLGAALGSDAVPMRWLMAGEIATKVSETTAPDVPKMLREYARTITEDGETLMEKIGGPGTVANDTASIVDVLLGAASQALAAGAVRIAYSIATRTRIALMEVGPASARGKATYVQAQVLRSYGYTEEVRDTLQEALEDAIRSNNRELEARVVAELARGDA